MNSANLQASEQPTTQPVKKIGAAWIVLLLLWYATAALVAAQPGIDRIAAEAGESSLFSEESTLRILLACGVNIFSILASFLQAVVLRLVYKGLIKGSKPTLRDSWFWVLLGQIPFMLTVYAMGLLHEPAALDALGQAWVRVLLGTSAAGIYVAAAKKTFDASNARLLFLFVVVALINSLLLVTTAVR